MYNKGTGKSSSFGESYRTKQKRRKVFLLLKLKLWDCVETKQMIFKDASILSYHQPKSAALSCILCVCVFVFYTLPAIFDYRFKALFSSNVLLYVSINLVS